VPIITEVEKNVDRIRDKLVAQMEKLGLEKYRQKRNQELSAVLKEIGSRTKPVDPATWEWLTPTDPRK